MFQIRAHQRTDTQRFIRDRFGGGCEFSRIEQLEKEARHLVSQGVKELLLIAQDSTYYGLDLYQKRNLAELLSRLADVDELPWIRLHYAFPTGFPEDVLEV